MTASRQQRHKARRYPKLEQVVDDLRLQTEDRQIVLNCIFAVNEIVAVLSANRPDTYSFNSCILRST